MKKIITVFLILSFLIALLIYPVSASDDYWSKKISKGIA